MADAAIVIDSKAAGAQIVPIGSMEIVTVPAALMPREQVVERLLSVFRARGYDGASLAELSKATGLGKSSLYYYFPGGKEEMAQAVLAHMNDWLRVHALEPLGSKGTPRQRVQRMIAALDECYAGGRTACLLGNMVTGGARTLFQRQLTQSFTAWIDALKAVLVDAGQSPRQARERAEDAVVRIEGALILAGGLGETAPFRRVLKRLPQDLAL
jgi:AcrR family transcriptional regulator